MIELKKTVLLVCGCAVVSALVAFVVSKSVLERKTFVLEESLQLLAEEHEDVSLTRHNPSLHHCIDKQVKTIKSQKNLSGISKAFEACESQIEDSFTLIRSPSEAEKFAVFMTLFVHQLAPYGESNAQTDEEILKATHLHCGPQTLMLARTIKAYYPEAGISQLQLYNPLLTSHGVVFVAVGSRSLLLDPTVGMIAAIRAKDMLSGQPLGIKHIADYHTDTSKNVTRLHAFMRGALMHGAIRATDVINTVIF